MSILQTIEAIQTTATQQAYVDLVGKVLREKQNNAANGNVTYNWLSNAITDVSRILTADTIKTLNIDSIETSSNWSNTFIQNKGSGFYDSGVLESFNTMPSNVGANVFVTNAYKVLVPEKDFRFANAFSQNTITTSYLSNYSTSLIANSNTYSNLNITTGLGYALANNYLTDYSFTSNSFVTNSGIDVVEDSLELAFAANKNIVYTLMDFGGGG